MGFTFRKRFKLMKGVHLNVGKTGTSVSVGGKGFSVTRGRGRTTTSVGIPGTGISYRSSSRADRPVGSQVVAETDNSARAYETGRAIAGIGLVSWMFGWLARFVGAALGCGAMIGLVSSLSSSGQSVIGTLIAAAITGALAWGFWWVGSKALRR